MDTVKFVYFWSNYSDRNNHIKRILVVVKSIDHFFCNFGEILESDELHLFLFYDGTRIDDNEYLIVTNIISNLY